MNYKKVDEFLGSIENHYIRSFLVDSLILFHRSQIIFYKSLLAAVRLRNKIIAWANKA